MALFEAWYQTGEHGKLSFEADSMEEAEGLLDQLSQGKIEFSDLRNHFAKVKGDELEFNELEQLED
jgi:hypothetical protein